MWVQSDCPEGFLWLGEKRRSQGTHSEVPSDGESSTQHTYFVYQWLAVGWPEEEEEEAQINLDRGWKTKLLRLLTLFGQQ